MYAIAGGEYIYINIDIDILLKKKMLNSERQQMYHSFNHERVQTHVTQRIPIAVAGRLSCHIDVSDMVPRGRLMAYRTGSRPSANSAAILCIPHRKKTPMQLYIIVIINCIYML